jgi:hypothetical protein
VSSGESMTGFALLKATPDNEKEMMVELKIK